MPTPPLSEDLMREAHAAYLAAGENHAAAARQLGIDPSTFRHRLNKALASGLHLSDGMRGAVQHARLSPGEVTGSWIKDYDDEGRHIASHYVRPPRGSVEADALDRIREAFEGMPAAPVVPAPTHKAKDLLTLYPLADAHIGMMAWAQETGEDYSTTIATKRLQQWLGACIEAAPPAERAVILDVGDLTHADDQSNQTPASKHQLDVDTRHFRTLDLTIAALAAGVELALRKHREVEVRILPGNHNPMSYMAVLFALAERYRDNERVTVQKEPGEFWCQRFGQVLLAAHHGDKAKAERLVGFVADQYAELWGQTRHRYLWTGHLHHHRSADIHGMTWEQLRALTARDAYAVSHAYTARAQLQAVTYHKDKGEVARVKVGL